MRGGRATSEPPGVDVEQERDKPGHVHLLVVVQGEVAAVGAKEEAAARELRRHPRHVLRVHGVVRRADHQRRHLDVLEVAAAVPVLEDAARLLPVLSAYLGHARVQDTYCYLSAWPELMKQAMSRLERRWEATP